MNDTNLSSRYLFNEIPDDQKTIDEFGYKACNLSLAKKWQFPVPETVFLSGELVKEIFEKKSVPAEILSHFKKTNKDKEDPYDLDKWQAHEEANPNFFIGMYQFWCQKNF